jgi:hypothetical protein
MVNIQNYIMNPFENKILRISVAFLCETYFIKSAKNSFQLYNRTRKTILVHSIQSPAMNHNFRKATPSEIPQIWDILRKAIARRKM